MKVSFTNRKRANKVIDYNNHYHIFNRENRTKLKNPQLNILTYIFIWKTQIGSL